MKCKFCLLAALFAAFFSAITSGCISDADLRTGGEPVAGSAVEFPTTISKTRAFDDKWEWGDDIGVYMIPASEKPLTSWSSIEPYAANKRYTHDMDEDDAPDDKVIFTGVDADNTILWPGDERKFDVVAYYPWRATIDGGHILPVDLSDQTSQKDLDLMWSNNVKGRSSGAPALGFVHKLSKLVFNVSDVTGASLDGMSATFDRLPTTASFSLAAGGIVDKTEGGHKPFKGHLHSTDDAVGDDGVNESAVVEAIVLPGSRQEGYNVTFGLRGGEQAVFTVAAPVYVAGNRYIYNIRLTPPAREGASFGADGELNQITQWGDGEEGDYPGEIPKTDPGPGSELSDPWKTVQGEQFLKDATVTGSTIWVPGNSSYRIMGNVTITKTACKGIVSVTVNMSTSSAGPAIRSVTVGDHSLVFDHNGDKTTGYSLPETLDPTDFIFRTTDGKPRSGDVAIEIVTNGINTNVYGFGTNTDIPKNNP